MIRLFNHHFRRESLQQILCDLGLTFLGFIGICLFGTSEHGQIIPTGHGFTLLAGLLVINTASGLYRPAHRSSLNQLLARAALALTFSLPFAYLAFSSIPSEFNNVDGMRWAVMLSVAGVIGHRVYSTHAQRREKPSSRVLILGSGEAAETVAAAITAADPCVRIVGFVRAPNEADSSIANGASPPARTLREQATALGASEIVVAVTERRGGGMPLQELLDCKIAGLQVSDISSYFEKMLGQIRIDQLHPGWLIFGNGFAQGAVRNILKRSVDIAVSCALLVLTAPLMLVAALCISLESPGPVFYRQERVGRNGKTFSVLKFRSMRIEAEKDGVPQWATLNDDRITRVGAVMRRFRIDELPQLFNVLKGEMSLVGPRPERPFFVGKLTRDLPFYAVRHSLKPGLTGWAQVRYQYGATMEDALEKLQYDLYYVKNHSLVLDVVILFETVGVVLSGKGAR
jgi:sugar transferase (PEP-CTERM system associated)